MSPDKLARPPTNCNTERRQAPTCRDKRRHTEPCRRPVAAENRIVELLERDNEFLRGQIAVKDKQISEMQERAHETNTLINGLQRLLAPLLAAPDRARGDIDRTPGQP